MKTEQKHHFMGRNKLFIIHGLVNKPHIFTIVIDPLNPSIFKRKPTFSFLAYLFGTENAHFDIPFGHFGS